MKQAGSPGAVLFSAGVLSSMLRGVSQFWVLAAQMEKHCRRGAGVHISIVASLEGTLGWTEFNGQFEMMDLFFCILTASLKFSTSSQVSFPLAFLSSHTISHPTSSSPSPMFSATPGLPPFLTLVKPLSTSASRSSWTECSSLCSSSSCFSVC